MAVSMQTGITTDEIVQTLGKTNVFEGLDQGTLGHIAAICRLQEHAADEVLYQPGDETEDIYVLLSGRVNFSFTTGDASRRSGSVISSRMVFGWAALIPEHPRRLATAVCIEPSTLLAINGRELLELLDKEPKAGFLVMQRLAAMIARNFMEQNV